MNTIMRSFMFALAWLLVYGIAAGQPSEPQAVDGTMRSRTRGLVRAFRLDQSQSLQAAFSS